MDLREIQLEDIKEKVNKMSLYHHVMILKILKENKTITLNENMNGFYINLSFLPHETIDQIQDYITLNET